MPSAKSPLVQKLIDKFSNSRDFTISFVLHVILVAIFGTTVLFQAVREPPDFEGEGSGFVGGDPSVSTPPPENTPPVPTTPNITVTPTTNPVNTITTVAPSPVNFTMAPMIITPVNPTTPSAAEMSAPKPAGAGADGLTGAQAAAIKAFTGGWGKGSGSGTGSRNREFEFTAYIGQYTGGNWNSTIRVVNKAIDSGSLPNLLYFMQSRSKNKVKTNYKNVKAIRLDSGELFSVKPPFVFLTGTRDFKLSDKEVENLRKYIRLGGAVWGDSSVPGRNSRFDIAFRREMKRVIPDVDKDWETLPLNHPIYTQTYYPEIREVPPGLNFYREPVYALKIYGEVAIIYTANDYGDMWQIGLNEQGQIDGRKDSKGQYVAINDVIWRNRIYLRNITPESLASTYKFGTNVVIHLLTRWENATRTASSL
ncbi:MAG: DUF4159 domain-containing protein [Terrimicrobiaceae bacterium]|nr:DUF4159 domain-containing protein [Terrimicrobiaceae bacterium]